MTILQVCAFGAPNAGNFIASLTYLEKKLEEQGIETVYAFVERAGKQEWCQEIQKRTKVYFLPEAKARILPKTYKCFKRIYQENDIDIVHSHFELYDIPATVMAPKKTKILWHLHDALKRNYAHSDLSRKLLTRLQYGVLSKRSILLSVSEEHAEFAARLGFKKENIVYFPNGISTERIELSVNDKPNNFLMFGWEVERKGVDLVVSAAEKIKRTDYQIIIVGQDECEKYLNETLHQSMIVYSKPVENINLLYNNAKAFLHVSRAEGLSYALLEVIYAGIPVICSDIPENMFAARFRNVRFVKNEDIDELANNIEEIISEVDKVKSEDVIYNRKLIDKEYSLLAWSRRLISLYERVLKYKLENE